MIIKAEVTVLLDYGTSTEIAYSDTPFHIEESDHGAYVVNNPKFVMFVPYDRLQSIVICEAEKEDDSASEG